MTKKLVQASKERQKNQRVRFDNVTSSAGTEESASTEEEGEIGTMTRGKQKQQRKKEQKQALTQAPPP